MYLDFLNNPIDVGDIILYPQCQGSSSATASLGRVLLIDPMVRIQHPYHGNKNDVICWDSKRPKPGEWPSATIHWPFTSVRNSTTGKWDNVPDDTRAYRLRLQKLQFDDLRRVVDRPGPPTWVTNVDRVTVITSLVDM